MIVTIRCSGGEICAQMRMCKNAEKTERKGKICVCRKNDTVVVEITDIGVNGEGIGKIDGYTLFIKDAVIGDVAEVKVIKAKKKLRICPIDKRA